MSAPLPEANPRAGAPAPLADLLWKLSEIERRLTRGLTDALTEANVTLDQWRVLEAIISLDSPTMGELAETTGLANASLSRIVDSLEDTAAAFRLPSATDRRRITVHLSDRGAQRLAQVREIVAGWERATERRLGPDAAFALLDAASSVARALEN